MKDALEDTFIGPMASPSFGQESQFRWVDSRRRVHVLFAGVTIADSRRVMLLHEYGRLPVFYFPVEDVRTDVMEVSDHHPDLWRPEKRLPHRLCKRLLIDKRTDIL
jgi:hypothetical protein